MKPGARIISLTVIAAHMLVAGVPCPPRWSDAASDRVAMTVEDARSLLQQSRTKSAGARTEAHPRGTRATARAPRATHGAHTVDRSRAAHAAPSMSSADAPPPCHDDDAETAVEARPAASPLLFLLPTCPCGCDQRAPVAGASTAKVGTGVPPSTLLSAAVPPHVVEVAWRIPPAPDVVPALPEPVPRLSKLV